MRTEPQADSELRCAQCLQRWQGFDTHFTLILYYGTRTGPSQTLLDNIKASRCPLACMCDNIRLNLYMYSWHIKLSLHAVPAFQAFHYYDAGGKRIAVSTLALILTSLNPTTPLRATPCCIAFATDPPIALVVH